MHMQKEESCTSLLIFIEHLTCKQDRGVQQVKKKMK